MRNALETFMQTPNFHRPHLSAWPTSRLIAGLLSILSTLAGSVWAQTAENVSFPGATGSGRFPSIGQVTATLRRPDATPANARLPAVVILHGSGGIDGRGAFYADALHNAGFATLEVFMFAPGARNREGHESTLTHAYGALNYLASRPDIAPAAIGAMGFSWGGNMALKLASSQVTDAFVPAIGPARFAAMASLYPVCWQHLRAANDTSHATYGTYTGFTAAPVLLLAGGKDDYGLPDDCQKFVATVAPASKGALQYQFYPDATHGWDVPPGKSRSVNDPSAFQGKGGVVRMFSDAGIAADSRNRVVTFFKSTLQPAAKP